MIDKISIRLFRQELKSGNAKAIKYIVKKYYRIVSKVV